MSKKLLRLRAYCEANPGEPFAWYSLAMEQKTTDVAAALELFAKVHDDFASYLPNYYHYAKTLADEGEDERAGEIFREGIALARSVGDAHTLSELEAALDLL